MVTVRKYKALVPDRQQAAKKCPHQKNTCRAGEWPGIQGHLLLL